MSKTQTGYFWQLILLLAKLLPLIFKICFVFRMPFCLDFILTSVVGKGLEVVTSFVSALKWTRELPPAYAVRQSFVGQLRLRYSSLGIVVIVTSQEPQELTQPCMKVPLSLSLCTHGHSLQVSLSLLGETTPSSVRTNMTRESSSVLLRLHLFPHFSLSFLFPLWSLGRDTVKWRLFQMLLLHSEVKRSQSLPRKSRGWLLPPGLPWALHLSVTEWVQDSKQVWNPALSWAVGPFQLQGLNLPLWGFS